MKGAPSILVVGARTTGLTMACELARHGAAVRIIDKSEGIDPHSRANLLHSRTLEIFLDLGIVDQVLAKGVELRAFNQWANGRCVAHVRTGEVDSPYPLGIALGQNDTEAILECQLGRLGVVVERRTELIDMVQHEPHVRATLRHADGREERVDTPWLVGCDGAHSTTRHLNHEGFPGEADPHQYVLADVAVDAGFADDEANAFLTDRGALFFFILCEGRKLVVADLPTHHDAATEAPTLADIQALVAERGPAGARVSDPRWLTYFRIQYRLADHYRHGRVLLAGDAAHVHSLINGQGMNTGIQDAYNLAWKLALVAKGRAAEKLLDSYEKERRDVAHDVVQCTRLAMESVTEWSHLSAAARTRLERNMVLPEPARLHRAQHLEELDLDYRKSPICVDQVRNGLSGGPHAGAQALDAGPLHRETRTLTLFELLRGTKHTLLAFAGPDGAWLGHGLTGLRERVLAAHGDLLHAYVVTEQAPGSLPAEVKWVADPENVLTRRYGATRPCFYLIRPDGYVGYRSAPPSAADLRKYLDRVFRRPVGRRSQSSRSRTPSVPQS
jgi:2-polyprenyl-6-methoxyphenol hydroxylase-like FAD-dependent oxidoreductase